LPGQKGVSDEEGAEEEDDDSFEHFRHLIKITLT